MLTSTQSRPLTGLRSNLNHFLIVPVFFKKQIETLVHESAPESVFGFLYGEQRENYCIIKKIWPLKKNHHSDGQIKITRKDFENALAMIDGSRMELIGCFYTAPHGGVSKAILSSAGINSFSFVEVTENSGQGRIWNSRRCQKNKRETLVEKVII